MSKPWSEAGLAADWAAIARNYVLAVVIVLLALMVLSFQCGRRSAAPGPSVIAKDSLVAAAYRDSLLAERGFNTSLAQAAVIAEARLDSAQRHVDSTGRVAARLTRGIVIDTVSHLATSSDVAKGATPTDTTAWAVVMRADDTTRYQIPKFIGDGFLALRAHVAALETDREAEHSLRVIAQAQFVDDSVHRVKEWRFADSTHTADQRQIEELKRAGHPWCGFKCGVVTTIALGVAIRYAVRR